ncbi:hypothetical protein [Aureimonas sp. AU20]|uniref:hypothetical protein n=1 Tax=Aureimonas sp. AU20 TaxID=1349819 RepID=UPI001FCDAD7D|nr:hypothetical protein [Aureimonas sp. AU20]
MRLKERLGARGGRRTRRLDHGIGRARILNGRRNFGNERLVQVRANRFRGWSYGSLRGYAAMREWAGGGGAIGAAEFRLLTNGARRAATRARAAIDALFHHEVVRTADQDQMLRLVAAHEHQLAALVHRHDVQNCETWRPASASEASGSGEHPLGQADKQQDQENDHRGGQNHRNDRRQTLSNHAGQPITHLPYLRDDDGPDRR